jgi:hypothetical protein
MRNLAAAALLALAPMVANPQAANIVKVSVLSGGSLLLNGAPTDITKIEAELNRPGNPRGSFV